MNMEVKELYEKVMSGFSDLTEKIHDTDKELNNRLNESFGKVYEKIEQVKDTANENSNKIATLIANDINREEKIDKIEKKNNKIFPLIISGLSVLAFIIGIWKYLG